MHNSTFSSLFSFLLTPVATGYRLAMAARNFCYDKRVFTTYESDYPVISVGNLTLGGNGKTPFVAYLTNELLKAGARPSILSRGYGGEEKGPYLVTSTARPELVGDEALMQARRYEERAAVVVARDRAVGAYFIESERLGNVILLDDGFQHRKLRRRLDVVLIDITDANFSEPYYLKRTIPAGPLREDAREAFKRADAVVFVTRAGPEREVEKEAEIARFIKHFDIRIPVFRFVTKPTHFVDLANGLKCPLAEFKTRYGKALTAIARPERFFDTLASLGIRLTKVQSFRDHHNFSANDYYALAQSYPGPTFVTAKDAVKLDNYVVRADELYGLEIAGEFATSAELDNFSKLVTAATGYTFRTPQLMPQKTIAEPPRS